MMSGETRKPAKGTAAEKEPQRTEEIGAPAGAPPSGREASIEGAGEPSPVEMSPAAAVRERDAQIAELQNKLLYLQAETENFKKRTERRYREALAFATEPLLKDLLPVLDNLERAVGHGWETGPSGFEALVQGLNAVIEQFYDVLRRHGVEPVSADGERFDPTVHEAMVQVPGEEDGRVGDVYEKGFTLKGRLLRPAKVTVTKVASSESDG